ncbi:MAG: NADPH-dependent FMN reductase [Polyangiaceae bacterium]
MPQSPSQLVLLVCGSLQQASANRAALDVARAAPGEAVLAFRAQVGAADAVVIAAPEYAGAVAGVVKNALDWVVGSGDLYGKPVALLSAGTSGGVFARRDLVRTLSWQGAHVVASLGIDAANTKSVSDADGSRRFTDPTTLDEIRALASSLIVAVAQRPSERLAEITKLARDAGVEQGPLAAHIAAQDEAWLRR